MLVDVAYDLNQNLIAKLFHERDVQLVTFDSDRLQLVKGLLSIQKLLLLTHQADKLQKYLHHEVALLDEGHCQPGADLPHSHISCAVEQSVYRLPQKSVFSLELL